MNSDDELRQSLSQMRRSYGDIGLVEESLPVEPFALFQKWLAEASANPHIVEPNAMVLSTSDFTSRSVLLKDLTPAGLSFFTNYHSRKAQAIDRDSRVSLLFPWYVMERQVIITGDAARVSDEVSDAYFASRPYGSQIGAWASSQSEPLSSRSELEAKVKEMSERYPEGTLVPRPAHWGGFVVTPTTIEFWQGRYSRLHDRIRYIKVDGNPMSWQRIRLNP